VKRRSVLPRFALLILALAASAASHAGIWDLFAGPNVPLQRRLAFGAPGLQVQEDFRVNKYCGYEIELRLVHKEGRMGEFDSQLPGRLFPITVIVDVFRYDNDRPARIGHFEARPERSGRGMDLTTFELGHIDLDKGRYRVELRSVDEAPAFKGVSFDFVIQQPPKVSCAKKAKT
jgi:hypothetical protein